MENKPSPEDIDYRIEPASIAKIIARGLGSNFPSELSNYAQFLLDAISMRIVEIETIFTNTMAEVQVVFHHPDNMKTYGFAFEPEIDGWDGQAMSNMDCWGVHTEEHFQNNLKRQYESGSPGRPVDFIVSPMVTCRPFSHGFQVKDVLFPMSVCVDWVAELEEELKEEEKQKEEEEKQKEEEETKAKGKGKAGEKEE